MSDFGPRSPVGNNCSACGQAVALTMRRCPGCGVWLRPWSTGGKPSRWATYKVGGSGRPDDWGVEASQTNEVVSSVWVPYGKNKDRVKQQTPTGQDARSGAHQPVRKGRNKKK